MQATEIKPDFGPACFNRGAAIARAGRPDETISAFPNTIRHSPEHLESYVRLAELLLDAGPVGYGAAPSVRTRQKRAGASGWIGTSKTR